MKQTLKAAGGLPGLVLIVIGIIFMTVVGCGGEDPLEPTEIDSNVMVDNFGATKKAPDAAPAAPAAVPEGTPTVTSVGYYSDWRLTEPLSGAVAPGTTFFVKVVFSEAMQHQAANENTAGKPILYYRLIGQEQVRFRIADHGASGDDFAHGYAKPFGTGTDDFVCKYTVPADANQKFRVEVGKFSADLEGNTLPKYYVHTEQLQLGQPTETEPEPEETTVEVPAGTPKVTEVGYYKDWKLTEPLTEIVQPGTTFYIKIVFSEAMQHELADDNSARPILYHRTGNQRHRFHVAEHGASGEDFAHGDVKPINNGSDDYIGKFTVPADATGNFRIEIGRGSTDLEGNTLPELYIHEEELQFGQPEPEPTPEPTEPEIPADTTPPTVLSITHYRNGVPIADGEAIPHSTIDTEVVFSEPVTPVITYTTGGRTGAYSASEQGGVHWRNLCKPTDATRTIWICRQNATAPSFTVTVTTDTADLAGNRLTEAVAVPVLTVTAPKPRPKPVQPSTTTPVDAATLPTIPDGSPFIGQVYIYTISADNSETPRTTAGATVTVTQGPRAGEQVLTDESGNYRFPNAGNEIYLRVEREDLEPKEVIVYRDRPTVLQNPKGVKIERRDDPEKNPGTVLMGQRWPDAVRFALQKTPLPNNLLFVRGDRPSHIPYSGFHTPSQNVVGAFNKVPQGWRLHKLLIHEIAHARQHAVAAVQGVGRWEHTPEAIAYAEARAKDWKAIGKIFPPGHLDSFLESAAEFCVRYWEEKEGVVSLPVRSQTGEESTLQAEAPNRLKWAQEWLSKRYGH